MEIGGFNFSWLGGKKSVTSYNSLGQDFQRQSCRSQTSGSPRKGRLLNPQGNCKENSMKLKFHHKDSNVATEWRPVELIILLAFVLLLCAMIIFAPHGTGVVAVTNVIKALRQ